MEKSVNCNNFRSGWKCKNICHGSAFWSYFISLPPHLQQLKLISRLATPVLRKWEYETGRMCKMCHGVALWSYFIWIPSYLQQSKFISRRLHLSFCKTIISQKRENSHYIKLCIFHLQQSKLIWRRSHLKRVNSVELIFFMRMFEYAKYIYQIIIKGNP